MRISENTRAALILRDRTYWLSIVNFFTTGVLLAGFITNCDHFGLLGTAALFLGFGVLSFMASEVRFDKHAGTCEVRRLTVFRRTKARLAFDDILDVKVETMDSLDSVVPACRLSLVTASAVIPLTAGYGPGPQRYDHMRETILDVLLGSAPPAERNPVPAFGKACGGIDAVR